MWYVHTGVRFKFQHLDIYSTCWSCCHYIVAYTLKKNADVTELLAHQPPASIYVVRLQNALPYDDVRNSQKISSHSHSTGFDTSIRRSNQIIKIVFLFLGGAKTYEQIWHDGLIHQINQLGYPLKITQIGASFLADQQINKFEFEWYALKQAHCCNHCSSTYTY